MSALDLIVFIILGLAFGWPVAIGIYVVLILLIALSES